jgi:hypothetical protein
MPTPPPEPPTILSLEDYPENTRGFWEAFSAEMSHHHYQQYQPTLLDKLDAMKQEQKRLPLPYNDDDLTTTTTNNNNRNNNNNSSSSKLINKLFSNKSHQQPKKRTSSTWWKGKNNDQWNNVLDSGINLDDRPVSHSPPLQHVS